MTLKYCMQILNDDSILRSVQYIYARIPVYTSRVMVVTGDGSEDFSRVHPG